MTYRFRGSEGVWKNVAIIVLIALGVLPVTGCGNRKPMEDRKTMDRLSQISRELAEKSKGKTDSLRAPSFESLRPSLAPAFRSQGSPLPSSLPAIKSFPPDPTPESGSQGSPRSSSRPNAAASAAAGETFPPELLLVRAKPSVFKIISRADAEIEYPRSASAVMTALRAHLRGRASRCKCDCFWAKGATDP